MASASSTSARSLFSESKTRLADRVQVNVNNVASVARQISRGSRANDALSHSARAFCQHEQTIANSEENLKKMNLAVAHLGYQYEAISKNCLLLEDVKEQVRAMQR
ncbi:BLOC-1-related complex subunit 7 [Neocloeon triangulifer]|uniref:BLOC-1-related complex subunit 7 n=1 Tax=Neocloeon triangulifer TaxID=2078957 RepID=UPI00286F3CB8|nr:BLOC-1-related complex subunit 7 [Neocloeon triangulifer]